MTLAVPMPETKPLMRAFRRRYGAPGFSTEHAERQGQITRLAFTKLQSRDLTLAFLNNPDTALGGRPLDIAIASKEGFAIVEQAIGRLPANCIEGRPRAGP